MIALPVDLWELLSLVVSLWAVATFLYLTRMDFTYDYNGATQTGTETTSLLMKDSAVCKVPAELTDSDNDSVGRYQFQQRRAKTPVFDTNSFARTLFNSIRAKTTGKRPPSASLPKSASLQETAVSVITLEPRVVINGNDHKTDVNTVDSRSSTSSPSLEPRNRQHLRLELSRTFTNGCRPQHQHPTQSWSSGTLALDADEHHKIAFCSALLNITPNKTPVDVKVAPQVKQISATPDTRQSLDMTDTPHSSLSNDSAAISLALNGDSTVPNGDLPPGTSSGDSVSFDFQASSSAPGTSFHAELAVSGEETHRNRQCTSYRLKLPWVRNPVDACVLVNGNVAVADYDNGVLVINRCGEPLIHLQTPEDKNACGVASTADLRLFVLVFKEGDWLINVYVDFALSDTIRCPVDPQIEGWGLRRIAISNDNNLYLMMSGEVKTSVWLYTTSDCRWHPILCESARRGGYNDISVRFDDATEESTVLLCDMKKSHLSASAINSQLELVDQRSIKVRRVKGQEWVVQGPSLASLDEQSDMIVYDSSGKVFFFEGDNYKCKKIIADVGRGEVSSICASNGWAYVLCRYRLCLEVFLYKETAETSL